MADKFLEMSRGLVFVFIFLVAFRLQAQDSLYSRINQYTTDNGLAHNSANCFIQDEYGFIWIGSNSGLERFDGYEFKIYQSNYQDSSAISNGRVTALMIDKKNILWVGTSGGGLNQYIRKRDEFIQIPQSKNGGSLSSDFITFIAPASGNKLWIGTLENGLNLFDPIRHTNKLFTEAPGPNALNSKEINCSSFDDYGDLWVGGLSGINLIDTTKNEVRDYFKTPGDLSFFKNMIIRSIGKDGAGNVWIGTWISGIYKFQIDTGSIISITSIEKSVEAYDIITVSPDEMAIATNKGLFFTNILNNASKRFVNDPNNPLNNETQTYISLYKDRSGILWFGSTNSGIGNMDLYQKKFELFRADVQLDNALSSNDVNGFEEGWNDAIWVSTLKGINKLNPTLNTFEVVHFLDKYIDDKVNVSAKGTYPYLWVGTDYGLIKLNTRNSTYDRYEMDSNFPDCLHNNVVNTLYYDSTDQQLWIGSWGGGLDLYDVKNNTWKNYPIDTTEFNKNVVLSIKNDAKGKLWLGTYGNGLLSFNPEDETFESFDLTAGNIYEQVIISLFIDSDQRIWIGTGTEGLLIYNPDNGHFFRINTENGLLSNEITGILENRKGSYWISSSKGITRINTVSTSGGQMENDSTPFSFHHFDFTDGLQANAFNRASVLKSSSGKFYFGGNKGFNSFFPDSILLNSFIPKPAFTSFELMGNPISPGEVVNKRIALSDQIYATDEIILSHSDKLFSLGMSAMHYALPEKNKFAYKLGNFDEEWIYTDPSRRFITFSDLKKGSYTLQLRAANNDGVWNNEPTILKIRVLPAWWNTRLFNLFLILGIFLIVVGIVKLRTNSLKKQKQLLKRIIQERTSEIVAQSNNIQAQNEELTALNETISSQTNQLSKSHTKLEHVNEQLKRTQRELKNINKKLELTVKERTAELEKKIKELDHFIYRASHDLSAPLKSILGLVHITRIDHDQTDLQHKIDLIESSVHKLENVIFSLKQFSQNSSQKPNKKNVTILILVQEILDSFRFVDHFNQIHIKINIDPKLTIYVDYSRFHSVISNLIDNAIKYYDAEKPYKVVQIDAQFRWNTCFMKISDNGIGVEKNMVNNVFNMFYRANANSHGSGLGLYIVKECMIKLEGSIKMKSRENEGTTFLLHIPLQ